MSNLLCTGAIGINRNKTLGPLHNDSTYTKLNISFGKYKLKYS